MPRPLNRYGKLATLVFRLVGLGLVVAGLAGIVLPRIVGMNLDLGGMMGNRMLLAGGLQILAGVALMGLAKPLARVLTLDLDP